MQRTDTARQPLQWDDVRLFLALCRSRTVGAAARQLGVDPSTVSRRLGALEQAVAATLFDRGRDGISATKAAEDLMPVAEAIEEAMARFGRAAEGLEREASGLVRITCPSDAAEVAVVPLVQELLRRHPALRIDLDAGEAVRELTRREADVAIRTVRPVRGDLIVTRLFTVSWVLAASPALARKLGTLRVWTDAAWVGWGERRSDTPPARWYAKHVRGEPAARSDSVRVQLALVAAGAGVMLMPARSVAHYGLVPVVLGAALRPAAATWPTSELYLVTHRALRDVPRVRVVWELLLERLAGRGRG
jgi:DNA-binding transcriptional LysR family regulator